MYHLLGFKTLETCCKIKQWNKKQSKPKAHNRF